MPERLIRIKLEKCWGSPYDAMRRIDILRYKNGDYYSLCIKTNCDGVKETIKHQIKSSEIDLIFELLSTVQIQAFPNYEMGCDGGFRELEVGGYEGRSSFRWWSVPPEGWDVLDMITDRIISVCGIEGIYGG